MPILIALLCAILVSGCATLGSNTVALATESGIKKEVSIDPIQFVGIEWTEEFQSGRFHASLGTFPNALFSDFHPLRFRYQAIAYGQKSGKEYPAQAIYAGYADCGLRLIFIVEGDPDEPIIGAFATTRFTRLFSLQGDEISVESPEKLTTDAAYRKEVVLSGGTDTKRLKAIPVGGPKGLHAVFATWTRFRIAKGGPEMRSPLAEKLIRSVARENPELAFQEKLVGNAQIALSLSWFTVAAGAAGDVITASNASDRGWDEQSELRRGQQGMLAQVIAAQYQAALNAGMVCR